MRPLSYVEPLPAFQGNLLLGTFAARVNYNGVVEEPPSILPLQNLTSQNGSAVAGYDAEGNACSHQRMSGRREL